MFSNLFRRLGITMIALTIIFLGANILDYFTDGSKDKPESPYYREIVYEGKEIPVLDESELEEMEDEDYIEEKVEKDFEEEIYEVISDKKLTQNQIEMWLTPAQEAKLTKPVESLRTDNPTIVPDSSGGITEIPNLEILNFAADDPCRAEHGNLHGDCVVNKFYETHDNDYDVLIAMNLGEYNDKKNGVGDFSLRRYMPYNLGIPRYHWFINYPNVPSRLRYMQQIGDSWRNDYTGNRTFLHELGHTWGIQWLSRDLSCYEGVDWIEHTFENSHWTQLFQTGNTGSSLMSYQMNSVTEGERPPILRGYLRDNQDGTFTFFGNKERGRPIFNYMDLYAMGLINEEQLGQFEMYTVMDPVWFNPDAGYSEDKLYSGSRYDFTLDDFKDLLKRKEACNGYNYFTGDGSRRLHEYDNGVEWSTNPHVALVLIKFPEEEITQEDAYKLCQKVNYEFIDDWNYATHGLSNLNTNLGDEVNPDCAALFNQ